MLCFFGITKYERTDNNRTEVNAVMKNDFENFGIGFILGTALFGISAIALLSYLI